MKATVAILVRVPPELGKAIDDAAYENRLSKTAYIVEAILQQMERDRAKKEQSDGTHVQR